MTPTFTAKSHGASLETFDINDDRAPMPIQYIEDSKDISSKGCSSFNKNLEIIESDSNAPLPFEYCPAVGSVMNERRYAMLKTKHAAMQSTARAIQCGADNDDSLYIDINDNRKENINANDLIRDKMRLETLPCANDPTQLEWYACDINARELDEKNKNMLASDHISDIQKKNRWNNLIQHLFNFASSDVRVISSDKHDGAINRKNSMRQSELSSKGRSSIEINQDKSQTSKKDSNNDRSSSTLSDHTDEHLAVAMEVDPSTDEPIYDAIEYDPESKPPFYHNRRCRVYTALSLLLFTIIVSLAVVYSTKKGKEEAAQKQIFYVTLAPTPRPTTDREALGINDLIEEKVLHGNAKFNSMDENDPRLLALDWILHKDKMQLDLFDPNLSQRYVLALLAFQFDHQAWKLCGGNYSSTEVICAQEINGTDSQEEHIRWLSDADECDWYGVECLGGLVRELQLREYLQAIFFNFGTVKLI